MNFYVANNGEIISVDAERVFQGSANATTLRFIGAFPSSAQVAVSYKLPQPSGVVTERQLMTFAKTINTDGASFNVWETKIGSKYVDGKYVPDYTILENVGRVKVQFFIVQANEYGEVIKQTTAQSSFNVEPGCPPEMPAQAYDDYEALLNQILAKVSGDDASKVSVAGDTMTGSLTVVTKDGSIKLSAESGAVEVTGPSELIGNAEDYSTVKYGPGAIKIQTTAIIDGEPADGSEYEVRLPATAGVLALISDIKGFDQIVNSKASIIKMSVDNQTYKLTASLYSNKDDILPISSSTIDLPLEEMVVNGSFDDDTDSVVLTLKNGTEVKFSVAQLVNGLVSNADFQAFVSQKGQANGFPSLDENGKIPKDQLPAGSGTGIAAEEFEELLVESLTNPTKEWPNEEKAAACVTIGAVPIVQFASGRSRINVCKPNGVLQIVETAAAGGIPSGYAIPVGSSAGCVAVAPPTSDMHATPKKYVVDAMTELRAEIGEILDLAGVTETVETTSTYDVRDTAEVGDATLKVLPGTGTKVTKVEGNGAISENMLNIEAIDQSLLSRYDIEKGEIVIKAISNAPNPVPITLGKFSDIIPTAKVGDTLYINAKDSAGAISGGVIDVGQTWTVNGTDALTVVAGTLDSLVKINFANTGTSKGISKLIVSKQSNPTFIPYYNGLKNSTFNGIVSSNKNLWDNNVNFWTKGTNTETSTGNIQHFSNWINLPVGVEKLATSINGVGQRMQFERVKVGNNEYKDTSSTGYAYLILANTGRYGITAIKLSTYLPPDTNLAEVKTQIEIGDTVTEYVPHESSSFVFPAIDMPLGRVLDFENKKVKDYGKEIVFTGNESFAYSYYSGNNSVYIADKLLANEYGKDIKYIATDGASYGNGETTPGVWKLGAASSIPTHIRWTGILDLLGFTEHGAQPSSTEEKNAALANFKAWLTQRYESGNPVILRYVSTELQSERDMTEEEIAAGNTYMPIIGGIEYQSGNIAAAYGANNTVTQEYEMYRKLGGDN